MVTDKKSLQKMNINLNELSYTLSRAFSEMIFVHGFVHCDPHPGNILIRPIQHKGVQKVQIVLLDHGLYRLLDESTRVNYSGI